MPEHIAGSMLGALVALVALVLALVWRTKIAEREVRRSRRDIAEARERMRGIDGDGI